MVIKKFLPTDEFEFIFVAMKTFEFKFMMNFGEVARNIIINCPLLSEMILSEISVLDSSSLKIINMLSTLRTDLELTVVGVVNQPFDFIKFLGITVNFIEE